MLTVERGIDLKAWEGKELGASAWVEITQRDNFVTVARVDGPSGKDARKGSSS